MLPEILPNGDTVSRRNHAVILHFKGRRRVLSTGAWNGGLREDLRSVFNYDMSLGKTRPCELRAPSFAEHMRLVTGELGLPPESSGLCTAAQMDNMAVCAESWDGVTVTALVTAGIDENGGRAGDTASWWERDGVLGLPFGTINLLLHMDCDLGESGLATALITATEAKCAAVQELLLPSVVSSGLATGSGTDGAILVSQPGGPRLTDAGKHSRLGELIGVTVLKAVKRALGLQTGATPQRLHDALRHLGRFGLTEEALLARAAVEFPGLTAESLRAFCRREEVWTAASLSAHLLDETHWGILTEKQADSALRRLLPGLSAETSAVDALAGWLLSRAAESGRHAGAVGCEN